MMMGTMSSVALLTRLRVDISIVVVVIIVVLLVIVLEFRWLMKFYI